MVEWCPLVGTGPAITGYIGWIIFAEFFARVVVSFRCGARFCGLFAEAGRPVPTAMASLR